MLNKGTEYSMIVGSEYSLYYILQEIKRADNGDFNVGEIDMDSLSFPLELNIDISGKITLSSLDKEEQKEQGIKHSTNKVPMSILLKQFPNALQAVALSGLYGHKKYEDHDKDYLNYKRVGGEDTYLDAGLRHQLLCKPEQEESGLPPKFHVAWNALADLEIFLETNKIDVSKVAELNIPIWENEFKK
jgi:hypothetical protein